jgi:hypothetical protein
MPRSLWSPNSALTWAIVSSGTTIVLWPRSRDAWTESSGKWQRLSSVPTSKGRMASLSVGHGSLSFATWSNGNKLSTRTRRPPVGPEKGRILSYIIPYPAPLSVTCLKASYSYRSFSHIPSLWLSYFTSAFLPQTLYTTSPPLPSFDTSALKMETTGFSEKFAWAYESTRCQNEDIITTYLVR